VLVCRNSIVVVRNRSHTFYISPDTFHIVGMYLIVSMNW